MVNPFSQASRLFSLDQGQFLIGLGALLLVGAVAVFRNHTKNTLALLNPIVNVGMVYYVIVLGSANLKFQLVATMLITNACFLMASGGFRVKSKYYRSALDKLFYLANLAFYGFIIWSSLEETKR